MALGGGTFVTQNKILPGAYINFVSAAKASSALSDRGIAAMGLELDWGIDGEVFEVTSEDFQKDSVKLFGYDYTNEKLKGLRDLFRNIKTLYAYKLNSAGVRAENSFASARFGGVRGNDLKVVIQKNADDNTKFDVKTLLDMRVLDIQTVGTAIELKGNGFVTWKTDAALAVTASTPLTGGTNGEALTVADYQVFLDKVEPYSFNALGVVTDTEAVNELFSAYGKRLRDEMGVKFQVVTWTTAADYEGTVNVRNEVMDAGCSKASLVYWVTGIIAGCEVNKSNLNRKYDGEFTVKADFTQVQLENAIKAGEFTLHKVGADLRVLQDINSLVTISDTKGDVFKDNQTIRVIDQIANDLAVLFKNKYLGNIPNDAAGRISLWSDVVKHHEQLQNIRAIENFSDSDVQVVQGDNKKAVMVTDVVTVVNAMAQLYMTVTVA